jgi:hypothetical protein
MNEITQLIIGILLFIFLLWICGGGNTEPNLTDGSNCFQENNKYICY